MTEHIPSDNAQGGRLTRRQMLKTVGLGTAGLFLAACGGTPAATQPAAEQPAATAAAIGAQPAATAAAPAQVQGGSGQVTLIMVTYTPESQKVLEQEIIPAFTEKNPGVSVKVEYSNWERYNEQMTTAFAGGVTPDVFQGGAVWTPQMAQRNWALPLDQYISAAGGDWNWEDFYEPLRDDVTLDGKILAVPNYIDIRSFWYNEEQLKAAGFEKPPTTWDELVEVAKACTVREGDKITREGFHFSGPGGWQNDLQPYMIFMHQAGGQILSEDLKRCTLAEPEAVEALEFIRALIHEHKVQPYPGFEAQGNVEPFVLEQASSTNSGSSISQNARQYAPERAEQLKVTLPLKHKQQATHVWSNKLFISRLTKNPDAAWAFLQHLTSKENLEKYSAAAGLVPPRKSLENAGFMTENEKTLLASTEYAVPYPKHPKLLELFRPFAENLEKCLAGEISAAEAMKQTCAAIDPILAST